MVNRLLIYKYAIVHSYFSLLEGKLTLASKQNQSVATSSVISMIFPPYIAKSQGVASEDSNGHHHFIGPSDLHLWLVVEPPNNENTLEVMAVGVSSQVVTIRFIEHSELSSTPQITTGGRQSPGTISL